MKWTVIFLVSLCLSGCYSVHEIDEERHYKQWHKTKEIEEQQKEKAYLEAIQKSSL